jgi:hypothetical protein
MKLCCAVVKSGRRVVECDFRPLDFLAAAEVEISFPDCPRVVRAPSARQSQRRCVVGEEESGEGGERVWKCLHESGGERSKFWSCIQDLRRTPLVASKDPVIARFQRPGIISRPSNFDSCAVTFARVLRHG